MNGDVWFLQSKRFWMTMAAPLVTWLLSSYTGLREYIEQILVSSGLPQADAETVVASAIASLMVGVIGMIWGRRKVTVVKPSKPPATAGT